MEVDNHLLKDKDISFQESPNHGGKLDPDTIIIHYTAGGSADSAIRVFADPSKKVSAHLVVGLNGSVTQMVPFNVVAWHAGKSQHLDRVGLNKYSIGIEIVNAGRLEKSGKSYLAWFGKSYPEDEVYYGVHRNETAATYWKRYTEDQISRVEQICDTLHQTYNIRYILGHEEIAPTRKIDPGPAFPLDKMRARVLDPNRDQNEPEDEFASTAGSVIASKLNIRSSPSVEDAKIANPLEKGKRVKILQKEGDWYKVAVEIEGWVSSKYVKMDI